MTKSNKYTGIYYNELQNGDKAYYITYKDGEGKMKRIKIGLHSAGVREAFCKQKRDEILNNQRLGEEPPAIATRKKSTSLKFSDVWEKYIENKAMVDVLRNDFRGRYNRYMSPLIGTEPANTLNKDHLKKFREDVQKIAKRKDKDGKALLSPRSVDIMITAIGTAYNYWNSTVQNEKDKLVNPVPSLRADDRQHVTKQDMQKRDVRRERFLKRDELLLLKEAVKDIPLVRLFVAISLSTGARLSSVLAIQKAHIDMETRTITLVNTKAGGSRYSGFINDELFELLKDRLSHIKPYQHVVSIDGNLITDRIIQRPLQRIINKLFNEGLDMRDTANRVVIHTLRHTFASHLAIAGTPIITIKTLLDHKDIATTMRYAKLMPDAGSDAVRGLNL
ncbi:MAG: site-specific integrase [Sulfuricurvum sp.]|nr:site-specific integrase [Sulfuricurvum sp.]MDP3022703.1 site-specific integrase [Sulfuricurvum sp.]